MFLGQNIEVFEIRLVKVLIQKDLGVTVSIIITIFQRSGVILVGDIDIDLEELKHDHG